jgi:RsiW-degrading membrane proteinase PrsW (M82 family)
MVEYLGNIFRSHTGDTRGIAYLIGQSLGEEVIKSIGLYLVFRWFKPASTRDIVSMGISVGLGFAVCESVVYHDISASALYPALLRMLGHSLFTGIIALLFSIGYFSQLRWIDSGARISPLAWCMRYMELIVLVFWTIFGIILAALLHSTVNILSSVGFRSIGFLVLMVTWSILIYICIRPGSRRPYGDIIREMDLLHTINDARHDLARIEHGTHDRVKRILRKKRKYL